MFTCLEEIHLELDDVDTIPPILGFLCIPKDRTPAKCAEADVLE